MILYISSGTSFEIYDELFKKGYFCGSSPAQKFNYVLMDGLAKYTEVFSLSSLLYRDIKAPSIAKSHDGVSYICVENKRGQIRKIHNVFALIKEGMKIIREKNITNIICDSIAVSPAIASYALGKAYCIPVTAIVTDIPTAMAQWHPGLAMRIDEFFMKRFDSYVLLTDQMNKVINPRHNPFIIMEGICSDNAPERREKSNSPKIILYTGALWEKNAGIEYLVKGFIKARLDGYELHLYGQGGAEGWIKKVSAKHPSIKYMGVTTNKEIIRKQAEASLLVNPRPSKKEFTKYSFPSKTIEYMLSGTPVLMTQLPGIPKEYYKYVYVIEDESAKGLSDSLKRALSDSDFQLKGEKAREFILENKCARIQAKRVYDFVSSFAIHS